MHRLFSTFARGWPGIGLLLMRLVAGVALLAHPHELEVLRTVEIAEEHFWLHRMQEPAKIRYGDYQRSRPTQHLLARNTLGAV